MQSRYLIDLCLLAQCDVVGVNDAWEVTETKQNDVEEDRSAVPFHKIDRERRAPKTKQVGEQVNLVECEMVQDSHRAAEEAEAAVDPELLVAFLIEEDPEARHDHSKASFNARHRL